MDDVQLWASNHDQPMETFYYPDNEALLLYNSSETPYTPPLAIIHLETPIRSRLIHLYCGDRCLIEELYVFGKQVRSKYHSNDVDYIIDHSGYK